MSERSEPSPLFSGSLGLQQRVLPTYRLPFFEAWSSALPGGLAVFAGQPCAGESITGVDPRQAQASDAALSLFFTSNLHFRNPGSPFYLCWQVHFIKWLAQVQPGALVVEANPRLRSTPAAVRWMHARRRPVIGWGLGAPAPRGPLASWRKDSWPRFLQQFDALVAYSSSGARQYQGQGYPPERIFVAPNAVTSRPAHLPPEHTPAPDGRLTVLFVGRLQARKRIDNLLHAAASLPVSIRPHLVVIGDGPARPGLQALAQQVFADAEFLGERNGQELEPYFSAADLFVLPGTGGLAVQMAMAHALPVIAAEGDGTLDALIRPENGWRVPPGDLPALAETLKSALSDSARLLSMGKESFRIVSEEVNLEKMVQAFGEALRASILHMESK